MTNQEAITCIEHHLTRLNKALPACVEAMSIAISAMKENEKLKAELAQSVKLPCKLGDTVYLIAECGSVLKQYDYGYEGTGVVECPFECSCDYESCDDSRIIIFQTSVDGFYCNQDFEIEKNGFCMTMKHFGYAYPFSSINKEIFFTREEAEQALAERQG